MLRIRLALVIAVSFCFVVVLGFALFWGAQQVELNVNRGKAAYEAFVRYEGLAQDAYRHFKQRMDLLLVDNEATQADVESSGQRLHDAIARLNTSASRGGAAARPADPAEQRIEKDRAIRLTAILESGLARFDEVERLRQQGKREAALLLLSQVLEENIDREFEPLIDAAINAEHERALVAQERLTSLLSLFRGVSVAAASTAALFSMTAGFLLFRSIRRPIEELMRGTDEIADGKLDCRISIDSSDEFGYLAKHFNQMARRLEQQQRKLQEGRTELEHKVAERTLELDRLNRELQLQDHARRQFFADISHELRTPITVIRGEAEIALRGREKSAEEHQEALGRILELSLQLGMVVNDLLFLARSETASLQFEWESVELIELVTHAIEDMRALTQDKAIAVNFRNPPKPVWVRGDRQRLRQVLFVLLDNSCRYSNPGTKIDILLRDDGKEAVLSITDQGIGVPAQDLEIIFDRYYRSSRARRSSEDGTGLGLPVAKAIIAAHGGRISASANGDGPGTTFTVVLQQGGEVEPFNLAES